MVQLRVKQIRRIHFLTQLVMASILISIARETARWRRTKTKTKTKMCGLSYGLDSFSRKTWEGTVIVGLLCVESHSCSYKYGIIHAAATQYTRATGIALPAISSSIINTVVLHGVPEFEWYSSVLRGYWSPQSYLKGIHGCAACKKPDRWDRLNNSPRLRL